MELSPLWQWVFGIALGLLLCAVGVLEVVEWYCRRHANEDEDGGNE